MRSLPFAARMTLIGAVFLLPIGLLIAVLYLQINGDVSFYKQERIGVLYTKALRPLFADLEAGRSADGDAAARASNAASIDADFTAALAMDQGPGSALKLTDTLTALQKKWRAHATPDALLNDFIALLGSVSDNSNITLDPILDGYYVGDTIVNKVPSLIDGVAQADAVGARALARHRLPTDDRISMTILSGQVETARDGIEHNVPIAIGAAPYLQSLLEASRAVEKSASTSYATRLESQLLKPAVPRGDAPGLRAARKAALAAAFTLYDAAIEGMDGVLAHRLDAQRRRESIIFTLVILAIAAAAGIMVGTTRSMARKLTGLTLAARKIAAGIVEIEANLPPISRDEIGILSAAFRDMAVNLSRVSLAAEAVAGGDLRSTQLARGSQDGLGRAFEFMVDDLRRLVESVIEGGCRIMDGSFRVVASATEISTTSTDIARTIADVVTGAGEQRSAAIEIEGELSDFNRYVHDLSTAKYAQQSGAAKLQQALHLVRGDLDRASDNVSSVTESAERAAQTARDGSDAIASSLASMDVVRAAAELGAERIAALREQSDQVGEIVTAIREIAEQTKLLALNAAIEAARAGQHGRGFAVVAQEIGRLAERVASETQKISRRVEAMRLQVDGVSTVMLESGRAVTRTSELGSIARASLRAIVNDAGQTDAQTQQIGDAIAKIAASVTILAETTRDVADTAQSSSDAIGGVQQGTDTVIAAINRIGRVTGETASNAERVNVSVSTQAAEIGRLSVSAATLKELASTLQEAVGRFRVESESAEQAEGLQLRKNPRLRVALPMHYSSEGRRPNKAARTRDIGGGGICFGCDERIAESTPITLALELVPGQPLELQARVVDSKYDADARVHYNRVEFIRIGDKARNAILNYIIDVRRDVLLSR